MTAKHRHGFTLPEVLLASAILAFAVVAISFAVTAGQAQTHDALHELRALALAEAMLEEIASLPYSDPDGGAPAGGADAGETDRGSFDNCDDFHGYAEAPGATIDAAGSAYPSTYGRFGRSVSAIYETLSIAGLGTSLSGLTVTVTVTDELGRAWQVTRFMPEPLQ